MYSYMWLYAYIPVSFMYMFYLLSSPYLHVFGDDRVRGTREQMLLMQVAQVKLSYGEGISAAFYILVFSIFGNEM